jgi:hypothetical protein
MNDGRMASTNTAESFFALLKRGHYGIFHQLSNKHLGRYCTEFGFRWDLRRVSDGERNGGSDQGRGRQAIVLSGASGRADLKRPTG